MRWAVALTSMPRMSPVNRGAGGVSGGPRTILPPGHLVDAQIGQPTPVRGHETHRVARRVEETAWDGRPVVVIECSCRAVMQSAV